MVDSYPPPPDLDVPAARAAARLYRTGLARGLPEQAAWEAASDFFALSHPSWPLPLTERECARIVGALIARDRARGTPLPRAVPPAGLVRRLADPVTPEAVASSDDGPPAGASCRAPSPGQAPRRDGRPAPIAPFLALTHHRPVFGGAPC